MEKLSEREKQVLKLLIQGLSNLEIAQRLFISKSTINVHIMNLYSKVLQHKKNSCPRAQLVDYAHKYNLLGRENGGNT